MNFCAAADDENIADDAANFGYADFAGLEHILLGDLRALLSEPWTDTSRSWIGNVLDVLLDLLPGQFAAEESDGYLRDVVAAFPHWEPQVANLQREHAELYSSLASLRDELNAADFGNVRAARVRRALRDWMEHFQCHQDAEITLLSANMVPPTLAS